jgi:acyl carrier protein
MKINEEALIKHVTEWVKRSRYYRDGDLSDFTEGTDLLAQGILDSRGFIEMMLEIEQQTGNRIDLSDVDPTEFTTIKGLCRCAMAPSSTMLKVVSPS